MSGFIGVTAIVAVLCLCNPCFASNPFSMGKVDYFSENELSLKKTQELIDWREPMLSKDGQLTYYTPPKVMQQLLDDPTPENARVYIEWQKERTDRIIKVQEVIARAREGAVQ